MARQGLSAFFLVLIAALTAGAACATEGARHGASVNVLVMGEDHDRDSVPRSSRVVRRVIDMLSDQLTAEGFSVYDETAIGLGEFAHGRIRRSDLELIEIAKAQTNPPIDVVVVFQLYARARPNVQRTATVIESRLAGRMLNPQSGRQLGGFEVASPDSWRAPRPCAYECVLETVGEHARDLARDLGAVLARQLGHLVTASRTVAAGPAPGTAVVVEPPAPAGLAREYELVLENMTYQDVSDIEEYVRIFSGYLNHRPVEQSFRRVVFWYETRIDPGHLSRNLRRVMAELSISARITLDGNRYVVERINLRRERPEVGREGW